ncbi:MAG: T9SS type A sorting domain-containing protein [Fidelibacterota bacterium]
MKRVSPILLLLFAFSQAQTDSSAVFVGTSAVFTVDANDPWIDLTAPDGGEIYQNGDVITCVWNAGDEGFANNPVTAEYATEIGGEFVLLASNLPNSGSINLTTPSVSTNYFRMKIKIMDAFGNVAEDASLGYISIGTTGGGIDTTSIFSGMSSPVTVDANDPLLMLNSPDGGEVFTPGEEITVLFNAQDESFSSNPIDIGLMETIGGFVNPLLDSTSNTGTAQIFLPVIDTRFARLAVFAKDSFGNKSADFSEGYFRIGNAGTGDTTAQYLGLSDQIIVDATNPSVDLLTPDGGEAILEMTPVDVQWSAWDESFDTYPIHISLSPQIGDFFTDQTGPIANDGVEPVVAPMGPLEYTQFRVTAIDSFGNQSSDDSQGYISVFESGNGAIQGNIIATRPISGMLYLSCWFPGSDPDLDSPDLEKVPVSVNLDVNQTYLYSFANLIPDSGYIVGAFIDMNGSPSSGQDSCDYTMDLSGVSLPITVETDIVTLDTDVYLTECSDAIPPATPSNFQAQGGNLEVILSWNGNSEFDIASYVIYKGLTPNAFAPLPSMVLHPDTTYTDSAVTNGQTYYYFITARDGAGNESDSTAILSVIPNAAPVWTSAADTSFLEDDSLTLDLYLMVSDDSDPDETLVFTIPAGNRIVAVYNEPDHSITFFTDPDSSGFSETFPLQVTDPLGASANLSLTVTVTPVNDPPFFPYDTSFILIEENPFSFTGSAVDVDNPQLNYYYDIHPWWTNANGATISGTPDDFASDTIFRLVVDDGLISDSLTIPVHINYINDPPVIVSAAQDTAQEDEYYVYRGEVVDPDNSFHAWFFVDYPTWLTASADSLFGTPNEGDSDTSFTVYTHDGFLLDTLVVDLTVLSVNDPPVMTSAVDIYAMEDSPVGYRVTGFDPEGSMINWSFPVRPSWLTVVEADSLYGTPEEGDLDTVLFVTGSDGELSQTWQVTINITPVNDPPVITSGNLVEANSGQYFIYHGTAIDQEDSTLFWSADYLPSWCTLAGDSVFGVPEPFHTDTSFRIVVSDGELSDRQTIFIRMNQNNQLPEVHVVPLESEQHRDVIVQAWFLDANGDSLEITWEYMVDNLSWQPMYLSDMIGIPGLDTVTVIWDSQMDLGDSYSTEVFVRVTAFDGIGLNYMVTGPFILDNHVGNLTLALDPFEEMSQIVTIPVQIQDPTQDHYQLTFSWSYDQTVWNPLVPDEDISDIGSDQYTLDLRWNSETDLFNQDTIITIAAALQDQWEYGQGDTIQIHIDNEFLPHVIDTGDDPILWQSPIMITMSSVLDSLSVLTGVTVTGTRETYNTTVEWNRTNQSIEIAADSGWTAGDQIVVHLSPLLQDEAGNPFDGNLNDDPDGVQDTLNLVYTVRFLGDYDVNNQINFEDLLVFRDIWMQDTVLPEQEVGPVTGTVPYFHVKPDVRFDFEDLMVFAQMWNWTLDNGNLVVARGSTIENDDYLSVSVTYPDRKPGEPDNRFILTVALTDSSLDAGAFALSLHYKPEELQVESIQSALEPQWLFLKKDIQETGHVIIQSAAATDDEHLVTALARITFERLQGEHSTINLFGDLRDGANTASLQTYAYYTVKTKRPVPATYALRQNYPNPFNPVTTIDYDLPEDTRVTIIIYDVLGKEIVRLVDREEVAGFHSIKWNGRNRDGSPVSAGMYLMSLRTPSYSAIKKLMLLK